MCTLRGRFRSDGLVDHSAWHLRLQLLLTKNPCPGVQLALTLWWRRPFSVLDGPAARFLPHLCSTRNHLALIWRRQSMRVFGSTRPGSPAWHSCSCRPGYPVVQPESRCTSVCGPFHVRKRHPARLPGQPASLSEALAAALLVHAVAKIVVQRLRRTSAFLPGKWLVQTMPVCQWHPDTGTLRLIQGRTGTT